MLYGFYWGGKVPRGRASDDGLIPDRFFSESVGEGVSESYRSRPFSSIYANLKSANLTLIMRKRLRGVPLPDSIKLIISTCRKEDRPYRIVDPSKPKTIPKMLRWVCESRFGESQVPARELHITGPTETQSPGIYEQSLIYTSSLLSYIHISQSWGINIWAPNRK
jgi:hypothetical protein